MKIHFKYMYFAMTEKSVGCSFPVDMSMEGKKIYHQISELQKLIFIIKVRGELVHGYDNDF